MPESWVGVKQATGIPIITQESIQPNLSNKQKETDMGDTKPAEETQNRISEAEKRV
ncbi:MAG: hypothetical protein KJ043_19695 [Anaerolineae bacterium]|nr:hypothetical protein [Anaerolineae bacterium]